VTSRRRLQAGCIAAALFAGLSADATTAAWATFKTTQAATTIVSAHALVTPPQPVCSGLGLLSAHLSWTAPSDASQADVYGSGFLVDGYDVGRSTASGGPFTFADNGTSTSYNASSFLVAGDLYFVVRSRNHSWHSANSPVRHVHVTLGLIASCP